MPHRVRGDHLRSASGMIENGTLRAAARRPRAAVSRCGLPDGSAGVACKSDPKAISVQACVGSPDSFVNGGRKSHTPASRPPRGTRQHREIPASHPAEKLPAQPIRCCVPHLALGVLGFAVVLIWGSQEFAGVLFSGTGTLRLSVGERIGCTRGGFSYSFVGGTLRRSGAVFPGLGAFGSGSVACGQSERSEYARSD
jgi:hypothetical protein